MAPRPVFNYDVFISYKSEQESWARRLAETLGDFGWKVWRDRNVGAGIRLGEKWSQEIRIGIRQSRWMIVLWSDLVAKDAASVVHEEIQEMERLIGEEAARHFIPILLDGTPLDPYRRLAPYQADVSFQELHGRFGDEGAAKVSPLDWYGAVRRVIEALGLQKNVMEIRFVVAAMDRTQAKELSDDPERHAVDPDAFRLLHAVMQKTAAFTLDRYGDSPDDWIPFPQLAKPISIREIITAYDAAKRDYARSLNEQAPWILVSLSEQIASPNYKVRQQAQEDLQAGPCLVIVDPVSLMHRQVFDKLITGASLHNLAESFIIGVAPFVAQMHADLFNETGELDNRLEARLEAAYRRFKKPFVASGQSCVMNVDHEHQFTRWLQVAAETILTAHRTPLRPSRMSADEAVLQRMRERAATKPGPEVMNMSAARLAR